MNLFRRKTLKWGILSVMIANFIFGLYSTMNTIKLDYGLIFICAFN